MEIHLPVNEHDFSAQLPAFEAFLHRNGYLNLLCEILKVAPGRMFVLGGALRDFFIFLVYGNELVVNDLDLVIDDVATPISESDMKEAFSSLGILERNRYNSYKLNLPEGKTVDIIPFTQSKYAQDYNELPSLATRLKTAFFGLESVALDPMTGRVYEIGFFKDLILRKLSLLNDQYGQYHTHYARAVLYEKKFQRMSFTIDPSVIWFLRRRYVANTSGSALEPTEKLIKEFLQSKGKENQIEYVFGRLRELGILS